MESDIVRGSGYQSPDFWGDFVINSVWKHGDFVIEYGYHIGDFVIKGILKYGENVIFGVWKRRDFVKWGWYGDCIKKKNI